MNCNEIIRKDLTTMAMLVSVEKKVLAGKEI